MDRSTANIETLLELAASTSSVLPWGVAVLESIGSIILWDTRPDATRAIIEAIAGEEGAVVESGSVATAAGPAVGAMIAAPNNFPSLDDLETIAGHLRFRYLMATRPEQSNEGEPF
jgi:hypothetical protein